MNLEDEFPEIPERIKDEYAKLYVLFMRKHPNITQEELTEFVHEWNRIAESFNLIQH